MIVDAHLHVDNIPALGWAMEASLCIDRLDEAGIDKGIIMTIVDVPEVNPDAIELIAEACAEYPDRLWAFARVHPWYGDQSAELLERAFSLGFKGLKLHPVSTIAHPSSEDTLRLMRIAAEHNAPTLFHCGDEPMTTPLAIAPAAEAVPGTQVILGHMGGYFHVDEAMDVAERLPNVILETSAMPYPDKIKEAVERIGPERVIYGSDGPVCSPRLEVAKVRLAGLDAETQRRVLAENTLRLIGDVA